jgi:hypothetical protein
VTRPNVRNPRVFHGLVSDQLMDDVDKGLFDYVHTCKTLRTPMLDPNSIVRGVHDLLLGRTTIEDSILRGRRISCLSGLRVVSKPVPLTALFCTFNVSLRLRAQDSHIRQKQSKPRKRKLQELTWIHLIDVIKASTHPASTRAIQGNNAMLALLSAKLGMLQLPHTPPQPDSPSSLNLGCRCRRDDVFRQE